MKMYLVLLLSVILMSPSCENHKEKTSDNTANETKMPQKIMTTNKTKPGETDSERIVLISTNYGDITVKLYNETPLHRDNFIKLASGGKLNGSIFHRVIKEFMIQGGSAPSSGGQKDIGDPIPAEIVSKYFHKKGALAAARMGDNVNPKRNSSGSQFYIVQGRTFSETELASIEQSRIGMKIPDEHRKVYKTLGGTPFLDQQYTVFGEVISGLEVVDKIASVPTNNKGILANRPLEDITMTLKVLK